MNLDRRFLLLPVLALSLSACKHTPSPATPDATQQNQNATAQPGQSAAQGSTSQPSANAPAQSNGAAPGYASNAARPAQGTNKPAAAVQGPPPPVTVVLPVGTRLPIRIDRALGSKINQSGDSFSGTLSSDIRVNNQVVIAKGARVDGTVIDAKALGRFKGEARLELTLNRVQTLWGSYAITTGVVGREEKGKGKRTAGLIGGGAGLGALIGGLAGGGKGALIGGAAGAGAGTAGSAFTGNKQIELPAESLLTFRLESSLQIVERR